MSDSRPKRDEKGIVLVMALLMTAILFIMAFTLAYNLSSYLKVTAALKEKTQTYYTTYAGLETMRDDLWNDTCIPPNWCDRLGFAADKAVDSYQDLTTAIAGMAEPTFGGSTYKIYIRDNEDGDADYTSDNDQIILASIESWNPATQTKTTIESMLIFAQTTGYAQGGKDVSKGNLANGPGATTTDIRQTVTH